MTLPQPDATTVENALKQAKELQAELDRARQAKTRSDEALKAAKHAQLDKSAEKSPDQATADLREFTNETVRENLILKTAMEFHIDPSDLDGDFQSPTEIRLYAQNLANEKRISQLTQALEQHNSTLIAVQDAVRKSAPSGATGDLSMVSAPEVEATVEKELDESYSKARALLHDDKNPQEATRRALHTIHRDPRKVLGVTPRDNNAVPNS